MTENFDDRENKNKIEKEKEKENLRIETCFSNNVKRC